jgi:short-subunit dehydrogenase
MALTTGGRPVVWVTGASRGIGAAIAKEFAAIGAVVCMSARNVNLLKSIAKEIQAQAGRAHVFPCDFRKSSSIQSVERKIRTTIGPVDILINNAGITLFKSFKSTTAKEFDEVITTNLLGPVVATRAVMAQMERRKAGWIFFVLSTAAVKTFPDSTAYSATKAGLLGFSRVLREEVRKSGVRVINVMPGATETTMWTAAERKKYSYRMMRPRSIAEAIVAAFRMPADAVIEEMIVRPPLGDIE